METKVKNFATKAINVLAVIIGILVLVVAISAISSAANGYSSFFGYTAYAVKTDSMEGDKSDSFNKGDLIFVKILGDDEKSELEVGKVITFYDLIDGKRQLNTHRIVEKNEMGGTTAYTTRGDNTLSNDPMYVIPEDVVGVYSSKVPVIGYIALFVQSPTGFLILVVIPSLLVVAYCVYLLVKNIKAYGGEKKTDDYEKLREQILLELEAKNKQQASENQAQDTDKKDT